MLPNPKMLIDRGHEALLALPTRRTPLTIDWQDEEGLEVDLSTPRWEPATMTMTVHVAPGAERLFDDMMLSSFVPMFVPGGLQVIKLRYLSAANLKYRGGYYRKAPKWVSIDITLVNDDPLQLLKGIKPKARPSKFESLITINGNDLSTLGVVVSEAYNTACLTPAVKEVVCHESTHATGRKVYDVPLYRQVRQIALPCSISYDTTDELLGVLAALWEVVSKPGALTLGVAKRSVQCYYSSMTDLDYTTSRLKFTLNLQEI